ncbi:MAG: hypothetical protein FWH41_04995 [Treponema sp.]|nr:hypothetical protein [Treponema sp.]
MKINTIMIVAIYLFFASCVTQHKYNTVYDENIPENESAFIIPSHEIKIILISDNKVNWKQSYLFLIPKQVSNTKRHAGNSN